ncbi:hypothetical protein WMF20_33745 [Sorangium sp. So ce834]|uniref:hypothetical protein n=1 Tax=Sorangium sp. So ce834 TaxID=3133321 RepID=UPI003F6209EB
MFLCEAYGDLLLFGFGFVAPLEQEESLRMLFTTMVSGAIVERGYSLHREARVRRDQIPAGLEVSAPPSVIQLDQPPS